MPVPYLSPLLKALTHRHDPSRRDPTDPTVRQNNKAKRSGAGWRQPERQRILGGREEGMNPPGHGQDRTQTIGLGLRRFLGQDRIRIG